MSYIAWMWRWSSFWNSPLPTQSHSVDSNLSKSAPLVLFPCWTILSSRLYLQREITSKFRVKRLGDRASTMALLARFSSNSSLQSRLTNSKSRRVMSGSISKRIQNKNKNTSSCPNLSIIENVSNFFKLS